ncbi:biopolymer transport protein ExbD [Roseimaritima multifibrata]|uniref:Biopolymer transport protein ExbD n=1 Tax=Roseimaritima multifibrata TaxID=1930274 RepID=A0A517MN28_9BACT|nr:biopolymer transporter ExbD [Roseimaritima multifibrata]QDS96187.1 biopolymer transport protein ExbD [Roseimaritima multifibrata]
MALELKKSRAASTLSLTPLIDVVFLLLIFFLVTSEFEEEERKLDIVLPSATSASPMTTQTKEFVIDINAKGETHVGGKRMAMPELEELLTRAVADNPTNQSVVIRADKEVPFQPVVSVMDLCNRTGVSDYSVTTQDGPEGTP